MRRYPNRQFEQGSYEAHVINNGQDEFHDKKASAYTTSDISDGNIKIARISGTTYLYVRYGNTISRVALTDI